MKEKLVARPTFNRGTEKWNIAVKLDGKEMKLGSKIDNDFFQYDEFRSKKEAIDYIKQDRRLELKNSMKELLNKYSRNEKEGLYYE